MGAVVVLADAGRAAQEGVRGLAQVGVITYAPPAQERVALRVLVRAARGVRGRVLQETRC